MGNIFDDIFTLNNGIKKFLGIKNGDIVIRDKKILQNETIDDLICTAAFGSDQKTQEAARWLIRRAGVALGIMPASIQPIYEAMGCGKVKGFTVPAINIRGMSYDVAQAVFRAAIKGKVGPIIFEIARSEIDYTLQRPAEYICTVTAAAIKTGYCGPIFLQGDHFQINAKKFADSELIEKQKIKGLIQEAIEAGFYNIDIDTSTLVDLTKTTVKEQQKMNYSLAAELTGIIRDFEPTGVTVSVGGEIGEVGGKNSTVEELQAFMEGYMEELKTYGGSLKGISKISVQTGTTHGGVPLADGSIAKVKIDFAVLQKLSKLARSKYGMAGAVQHGASTLPDEAFDRFPAVGTAEIHLATGFQNMIYDSLHFPKNVRERMYKYLKNQFETEWKKEEETEEQFIYKIRKKGFGPFKESLWYLSGDTRRKIGVELEEKFTFLFDKLKVNSTQKIVEKYIQPVDVSNEMPNSLMLLKE